MAVVTISRPPMNNKINTSSLNKFTISQYRIKEKVKKSPAFHTQELFTEYCPSGEHALAVISKLFYYTDCNVRAPQSLNACVCARQLLTREIGNYTFIIQLKRKASFLFFYTVFIYATLFGKWAKFLDKFSIPMPCFPLLSHLNTSSRLSVNLVSHCITRRCKYFFLI